MASHQWNPPLPAGFEARWDPNQRAYFFIDHNTKTTTWQDPRFAPRQQQQHHQAAAQSLNTGMVQKAGGQGQHVPMSTMLKQFGSTTTRDSGSSDDDWEDEDFDTLFSSAHGEEKKIDMMKLHEVKQSFPKAPESIIRELLDKHNNSMPKTTNALFDMGYKREHVSHPPPKKVDMLQRLKAMFPTANTDLVEDLLESCGNDEKRTREQLESIGYKPTFPETHRNPSARGGRQASPAKSPVRQTSPARQPSPAKQTTPKKTISEIEKKNLVLKLQSEYTSYDKSVIEMALQVCDYDETRAKNVLERMKARDTSQPATGERPATSTTRTRSPSPTALSPTSLEPVSLFDDVRPSSSRSGTSGTSGFKKSSDSASRPSTGKSTVRPSTGRATTPKKTTPPKKVTTTTVTTSASHQHRAKQVTQMSKDILSSTIATLSQINCCTDPTLPTAENGTAQAGAEAVSQSEDVKQSQEEAAEGASGERAVVSRQPQPSREVYVSAYRTAAKGPDPSLHVGPNKALLLTEYTVAKGPNPELRHGPDPSRVQGSQGAVGPDRSLACGPQHQLRQGPSHSQALQTVV